MVKKIVIGTIIIVILLIAYNLIVQIMDAVRSGERLSEAAEKVYTLEIKNKELKEELVQAQSAEYIEQQARDKLGLGRKGETAFIIPEDKLKLVLGTSNSAQIRLPNYLGWFKVFFKD